MRLISAGDAASLIADGATVAVGGSGAGHAVPQRFIDALEQRFLECGRPRDLTTVRVVGIGDFDRRGFSQLAHEGLMRRTIGSNIGNEPALGELVRQGRLEAYSFPQGVLSQLMREIAGGRPGVITQVGLHTYVDPRQSGGRQNSRTTEDLVEVVSLAGKEWLFFRSFPIDVAVIRGTTIDEAGSMTMNEEVVRGEMLAMAMAAHNSGGIVIAQARELALRDSLPARDVVVPGALVDFAYLDPGQWQTYQTATSPYYSGRVRQPRSACPPADLDIRLLIARRTLMEIPRGSICNLGFGIPQLIGNVAAEEGIDNAFVLTVEQGVFGGIPSAGLDGGAGVNYQALIDQPYMFDFYDGGGLDFASLSFAEVDVRGNVNVHAFGDRLRGPGGFCNIAARTRRVCFVGTLTTKGLLASFASGRLTIIQEGRQRKFVTSTNEITYSSERAACLGQSVKYITERCVFELCDGYLTLTEIADGLDVERDVISHMDFVPRIAPELRRMDPRLFTPGRMGISSAELPDKASLHD